MPMSELGRVIREARESAGLTQEQLAKAIGKSQPTISALERGEISRLSVETLTAILQACGVPSESWGSFLAPRVAA